MLCKSLNRGFAWAVLCMALGIFGLTAVCAAADAKRPFKAVAVVTQPGGNPAPPEWIAFCVEQGFDTGFTADRSGKATHLGAFTYSERGCLDFSGFPLIHSGNVEVVFYAANGDQLRFISSTDIDLSQDPPAFVNCVFEFTGGTGRFATATGVGTCTNTTLFDDPGYLLSFEGWISYRASDRSQR